jgi:hypothetical protein
MKKSYLLFAVILGIAFLFSCIFPAGGDPIDVDEPPVQPVDSVSILLGTWYITHEYFRYTVAIPEDVTEGMDIPPEVLNARGVEFSLEFTEDEAQQWTFSKGGIGRILQRKINPVTSYRHTLYFSWNFSGGRLFAEEPVSYSHDMFLAIPGWEIEEFTEDKMVLSRFVKYEGVFIEDLGYNYDGPFTDSYTLRYTFKR